MASLDISRSYLAGYEREDVDFLLSEIQSFKEALAEIKSIKVLTYPMNEGDPLKITIQSKSNLTGIELQKKFEANGIYTELADPYNVLFIMPLLKKGQVYPLSETAAKIKGVLYGLQFNDIMEEIPTGVERISELAIRYSEMEKLNVMEVKIERAAGLVCAETIIPYPPGIPLLMKGERITSGKIGQLNRLLQTGARFQGDVSLLKAGYLKTFSIT
jgi:arginine/lysine/ornithine decarboxylase